ncbi:MAG: HD domain-containing protein [Lachnospiraceae bacterium]|nr:HD domain-containing protein [Lachnospiraceae bacterium]
MKMRVPKDVDLIIKILEKNGYEAFAVGGCVRDTILGREPQDWDITTSALPMTVKELFNRTIDTGLQHGTVTVMMKGVGYEVTTYRIDGEYNDSRHPDSVEFTSNLIEDLKRRDFTINAMAFNPKMGLVDAFDGIGDIERKVIKCVGNAEERFGEDALRILRAVRFSAQLGFDVEANTRAAASKLSSNLVNISKERIHTEMEKLILSNNPGKLKDAYEMGITKYFFKEFDDMMECEQNTKYHKYNVGEHTIKVMENVPREHFIRWAALLHDVGKPVVKYTDEKGDHFKKHAIKGKEMAHDILRRLKMDNKTINVVSRLTEHHDDLQGMNLTETNVRKTINRIGDDIYPLFLQLVDADTAGKSEYAIEQTKPLLEYVHSTYDMIIDRGDCYCTKMLAIAGRDLIAMGIGPGPIIGDVLDELLSMVIANPELNTEEKLKNIVIENYITANNKLKS